MKIKALTILLIFMCVIMASASMADAQVTSGKLYDLGYSYQMGPGLDASSPWTSFQNSYTHVAQSGQVIGQIYMTVPYNDPNEILYFNIQLNDGSTHKGTYQCIDANTYRIYLDGVGLTGTYRYSYMAQFQQLLGVYNQNLLYVLYAANLNDRTQRAVYVESQCYGNSFDAIEPDAPVVLLTLGNPSTAISGFSATSTHTVTIQCSDESQPDLAGTLNGQSGVPSYWQNATAPSTGLGLDIQQYIDKIKGYVSTLFSVGDALIKFTLLILSFGAYLLDPLDLVMFIMQFWLLTAIMALSMPGDILNSGRAFLKMNSGLFTFLLNMARIVVQIIGGLIQALVPAIQLLATAVTNGISALQSFLQWVLSAIILIPK